MRDKQGQISETMTWIVATVIIAVILIVSVSLASLVGDNKSLKTTEKIDLLAKKSMTAFLLTKDETGMPVFEQINDGRELNDFAGNLASQIFTGIYSSYYGRQIYFGIREKESSTAYVNKYFTSPVILLGNAPVNSPVATLYLLEIGNNKLGQLVLWRQN